MATSKSRLTTLSNEKSKLGHKTMSRDAIAWLKDKIAEIKKMSNVASVISKEQSRQRASVDTGYLYFFYYDAKNKDTLEYWDRFPLVLVLETYTETKGSGEAGAGFLGLNLHYLPLKYRVVFLTKLMQFAQFDSQNNIARLKVSYDILKAAKKYAEFKPCLKRYLESHIQSHKLKISPNEWDTAMLLPIQQFKGAKAETVWKDSVEDIKSKKTKTK